MIGIYKITSPTGKIYIGQSWNIDRRKNDYRKLNCKSQSKLYNSLISHGWDSHLFEIIKSFSDNITQDELNHWEIYYWKQYIDSGFDILNLQKPGNKSKPSKDIIDKISKSQKGENAYWYGKKLSNNTKEKIRTKLKEIGMPDSVRLLALEKIRGKCTHNSKKVQDIQTGLIHDSILKASKYYGVSINKMYDFAKKGILVKII